LFQKKLINDYMVLPGLLDALKQNLGIQEENPSLMVVTDVFKEVSMAQMSIGKKSVLASVIKYLATHDGKIFFRDIDVNDGKQHLMVAFGFDRELFVDRQAHDRFKKLGSYELFTCRKSGNIYEYAIDFGEDAEGAARILSEALHTVHKIPYGTQLNYKTYFGNSDNIEQERDDTKPWYEKYKWWLITGVLVIGWLIKILSDL
jgi:hypothetical protein